MPIVQSLITSLFDYQTLHDQDNRAKYSLSIENLRSLLRLIEFNDLVEGWPG